MIIGFAIKRELQTKPSRFVLKFIQSEKTNIKDQIKLKVGPI